MRRKVGAAVLVVAIVASGACRRDVDGGGSPPPANPPATTGGAPGGDGSSQEHPYDPAIEVRVEERATGGSVRVGVWAAPDPDADTTGGSAVRALVFPQLFVARPDGRWSSALAEPGSDRTADDLRSASFRLRAGASWSDGSPITAGDLRRTADGRFVSGVEGPAADGAVTVRFTSELPGWRRLWSANDAIAPPTPGIYGGPFLVAAETPGLETVLVRNDRWWGSDGPFLDEVRLVLVPDPTTARLLLGRGELDVVMPLAGTARTSQLAAIPGVEVERSTEGGWRVALEANPVRLSLPERRALLASFDRAAFVRTLLQDEASLIDGFGPPGDAAWAGVGVGDPAGLEDQTIDLVGFAEEPMTPLVHRSMQKRVRSVDGTLELRSAEADRVEGWLRAGTYDGAVVPRLDPLGGCWVCRWPDLPASMAAEGGDPVALAALQAIVRDEARALPLWDGTTVIAYRDDLVGVTANGFAPSGAWNAWEWSRTDR